MSGPAKAPLEGDRIGRPAMMPDFLAAAGKAFFVAPRWKVKVYVGGTLVKVHEWISALDAEAATIFVRNSMDYTDGVRYEVERVEEFVG